MCCLSAQAGNITYSTPTGSSVNGGPVDAKAVFSIRDGMIDVTLVNLLANPKDAGQLLSDLSFTLGGGGSLSGATLSNSSGQEITVGSTGSFTLGSTVPTGWGFSKSGTTTATLDVLGTSEAPKHLIIGPPGSGNTYSNANGSIAGNKPHNPFLNGSATFVIAGSGITASTTITSATFSFGTTPGMNVSGTPTTVPEPSSSLLLGLGTLGLMGLATASRKLISS
jgi:hypothetical protein